MKRLNFNIKDRKVLYMILCVVLVCVFTLTIAYAALNAVLIIQGNAQVSSANWNIHLDNVKVTIGSVSENAPSITSPTTATFSTTLTTPGDFYEFTIDVVNDGTIDAMIDSVTKEPTLTSNQSKYLNYIIEYQNGESINTKQLVSKNSFVRLKVRVEYRKDISASDLPTTSEMLNLSFTVNYVQSDNSGTSVIDNGVVIPKVVSGDLDTIGSEICIKEECFYVISSTTDTVTMLSKYNLHVGNEVTMAFFDPQSSGKSIMTLITYATVMQHSSSKGVMINFETDEFLYPWIGTVAFATENKHGANYSDYSGSIVEGYVNDYKKVIEGFGITIDEARLITKDELVTIFGCDESVNTCEGTNYPWIYSTSYWTASSLDSEKIYYVTSFSYFYVDDYFYDDTYGIRPVITISKSYF